MTNRRSKRHELLPDIAFCAIPGPARNDEARLADGDLRSGTPSRFGPVPTGTASPGHTILGHDDSGVVEQRDSGYDKPEHMAYATLAWEG